MKTKTKIALVKKIINQVFDQPLIEYVDQFDDDYLGFDVIPRPGHWIRIMVLIYQEEFRSPVEMKIYLKRIEWDRENAQEPKKVFFGDLPKEAELKFILEHYQNFGM